MTLTRNISLGGGLAALLLAAPATQAQTITFENLAQPGMGYQFVGSTYTDQGYVFTDSGSDFLAAQTDNLNSYAGSTGLSGAVGGTRTLKRVDNAAFTLTSIDLSLFVKGDPNFPVTYTGTRADNSTVTQSVVIDQFGFETYPLNGFDHVTKVTFGAAASGRYQFDNVALSTPASTPEPPQAAAMGLGALGLAGLALRGRKRRKATAR